MKARMNLFSIVSPASVGTHLWTLCPVPGQKFLVIPRLWRGTLLHSHAGAWERWHGSCHFCRCEFIRTPIWLCANEFAPTQFFRIIKPDQIASGFFGLVHRHIRPLDNFLRAGRVIDEQ